MQNAKLKGTACGNYNGKLQMASGKFWGKTDYIAIAKLKLCKALPPFTKGGGPRLWRGGG